MIMIIMKMDQIGGDPEITGPHDGVGRRENPVGAGNLDEVGDSQQLFHVLCWNVFY